MAGPTAAWGGGEGGGRARLQRLREENLRREKVRQQHHRRLRLTFPLRVIRTGVAILLFIVFGPVLALYRAVTAPVRWWQRRQRQRALQEAQHHQLPPAEDTRRARRDERRTRETSELRHEPLLLVVGRIVRLVLGVAGAGLLLGGLAHNNQGGFVVGLRPHPLFLGFLF